MTHVVYLIRCSQVPNSIIGKGREFKQRETHMAPLIITASVPVFGRVVHQISRGAAYEAAKRGEIPTMPVGGLKRVPVMMALKPLGLEGAALAEVLARLAEAEAEEWARDTRRTDVAA